MRIADHPKKFGLLLLPLLPLLPLIPLTAIGVVEVTDRISGGSETCACAPAPIREELPKPVFVPVRNEAPHPAPPA